MNILVDAMGGDYAPEAIVAGCIEAVNELGIDITFVGLKDQVEAQLKKYKYSNQHIHIIHAPEVVGMDEPATTPIRKKKESSISVGIKLLKEDQYDAFVSAGNTGAVVAASTIYLGLMEGVERPAIGTLLPTLKNFCFLMDVGANTDAKPEHLLHSALMAKVYAKDVLGVSKPTIGLLNIGEESTKGTGIAKEAHGLLEERLSNFIGNVEPNDVYAGKADCVICDGFVGNIFLKVSEGLMENAGKLIKREIKSNPIAIFGAMILKLSLKEFKKLVDYSEYGGAPLLGVNGVVMIGHGRSSPKAVKNAIKATKREVEHKILAVMAEEILK